MLQVQADLLHISQHNLLSNEVEDKGKLKQFINAKKFKTEEMIIPIY